MRTQRFGGTVNGRRFRGTVAPGGSGWAFTVGPAWVRDSGLSASGDVIVELEPEGPQRDDLADDVRAALKVSPAAAAFFDTLPQFYRKAYLRWIDATTPQVRAALRFPQPKIPIPNGCGLLSPPHGPRRDGGEGGPPHFATSTAMVAEGAGM